MDSIVLQLSLSTNRCISFFAAIALVGLPVANAVSQTPVNDNAQSKNVITIVDVALDSQGQLALVIVDKTGRKLSNIPVTIAFQGQEVARAKSDPTGTVIITGLRPGLHSVTSLNGNCVYRFWTPDQAPPSCVKNPALTVTNDATRGQYGPMMGYPMQPMMGPGMMAPGLLATGVTAAAVVVVLVGKSSGDDAVVVPTPASP